MFAGKRRGHDHIGASVFGVAYRYRTRGIFGGCTELSGLSGSELTEVSDSGIKFVPNHTGVFGCSVWYTGIVPGVFLVGVPNLPDCRVPNLLKCRIPVSSSYRTIPECSVGY